MGVCFAGAKMWTPPLQPTDAGSGHQGRALSLLAVLAVLLTGACSSDRGSTAGHDATVLQEAADGGTVAGEAAVSGTRPEGLGGTEESGIPTGDTGDGGTTKAPRRPPPPPVALPDPGARPSFRRPEHVRGIYLNAWASGSSRRLGELLDLARGTELNTFVLDMKDATGYVSYASGVPAVRESGALGEIRIRDLPGLLERLRSEGVYPVARIVIVKDPLLIAHRPELAVQDTAGGVWVDSKELVWLNLYNEEVWAYHVDLAEELVRLGFPAIQWDYVRFPDAQVSDLERASFPGDTVGPRRDAVRRFLAYARQRLKAVDPEVEVTADVFGVTTAYRRDVGIGQVWESFIDQVDAALPMVYPSHYWEGSYGYARPNARPYEILRESMEDAVRRSAAVEGAGRVIPWLQDFTLGAPRYGAPEVRAQIQGAYDAGVFEWILWNPGSRYTVEALEPVTGFHLEPLIRVADGIATASDRFRALEREQAARAAQDAVEASETPTDSASASAGAGTGPGSAGAGARR